MSNLASNRHKPSVRSARDTAVQTLSQWQTKSTINPVDGQADDPQYTPYVRYGLAGEDGNFIQGKLRPLTDGAPDGALTASTGIYFLTDDEADQHADGRPAKDLQARCEKSSRVYYSVVAESDALEDGETTAPEVTNWLITFAEDWLDIEEYKLYFSGRRSIHLHADAFVAHDNLDRLKDEAEAFNDEYDAELDTSIYDPKSQFRLPGVQHRKSDLYKVEVNADDERPDLTRKSIEPPAQPANSDNTHHLGNYGAAIGSKDSLPPEIEGRLVWGHIKGGLGEKESEVSKLEKDCFDKSPYSPYANAKGGQRSICLFEPEGGPLCKLNDRSVYVPGLVREAIGADGHYRRYNSRTLIQLSPQDFEKWEYEDGDTVVILGGRSHRSRMIAVDELTAEGVKGALSEKDRMTALEVLQIAGYDTGDSGRHGERTEKSPQASESKAAKIKRQIDRGEREITYDDTVRVSCQLLRYEGWQSAWDWLRRAYGERFDPEITYTELRKLVNYYDDLSHVQVPPSPGATD